MSVEPYQTLSMATFEIVLLPCLADNYCVLLHDPVSGETAAIDAPQAATIKAALDARNWRLNHLFITHHHTDHTAGIAELKGHYGASVTGPEAEAERIPGLTRGVTEASCWMVSCSASTGAGVRGGYSSKEIGTRGATTPIGANGGASKDISLLHRGGPPTVGGAEGRRILCFIMCRALREPRPAGSTPAPAARSSRLEA